jgi:hypothetical protein
MSSGSRGGIRTRTGPCLRRLSLPLGLRVRVTVSRRLARGERRLVEGWWRGRELNPRRTACKAALRPDGLPVKTSRRRGRNRTSHRPLIVRLHCPLCYAPMLLYPGLDSNLHWMRSERIASAVGLPGQNQTEKRRSTAGESNASLLLGRQGPSRSDSGASKHELERSAGTAPALPSWLPGVPLTTP